MSLTRVRADLANHVVGRAMLHFSTVGSTNYVARDLAGRHAPEGTVVLADYQTAGRGRHGRAWLSDPGASLLLSIVLQPRVPPSSAFYLTIVPALAVRDAVVACGVSGVALKWPNDVQIAGRKVAGILTELSLSADRVDCAVVGIGLNVNLRTAMLAGIAGHATSIADSLGREIDRAFVLRHLLEAVERHYAALQAGQEDALFANWRDGLATLRRWVAVSDGRESYQAFAEDVTPDGGLVVIRGGQRLVLFAGDVTLAATT